MIRYLLDTHILLWWVADPKRLTPKQRRALVTASPEHPLGISEITLWEIATLQSLGRLALDRPLRVWLEQACAPPLVRRLGITPAIAAEVARIPDSFHRDPADRLIVATARVHGATLVTRDRKIIDAQLVPTL